MIDTHSHIDMLKNPDAEIEAFLDAGVKKVIIPGVEPDTFDTITEYIDKYDCLYGALGVHPSEAQKFNDEAAKKMMLLSHHPKILAIGEIGLDYYWDKTFVDIQKKVFKTQIEIAKSLSLPIIVHDREAHLDTFNILSEMECKNVVMHCFSGSLEFAKQCVDMGWYLGIGGVLTFKNARKMKDIVREIPLENLLLETDAPYLTPHPFRGEENSPKYLNLIAKEIANLKDLSFEFVQKQTTKNAELLFNFNKGEQ